MDDKTRAQVESDIELGNKVSSVMGHPEWQTIVGLIDDERKVHSNKAHSVDFRQDPSQYANIVRAMDNADAVQAILDKFNRIVKRGREAQEKLDVLNGITEPKPR